MAVIAIIMFLFLASALGVAQWLVDHKMIHVRDSSTSQFHAGDLSFELPPDQGLTVSHDSKAPQNPVLYIKGSLAPIQLSISLLPQQMVSPPWLQLQERVALDEDHNAKISRPTIQPVSGQMLHGQVSVVRAKKDETQIIKALAMLTLDGSRYWQISLKMELTAPAADANRAESEVLAIIEYLANSAKDDGFRNATKEDYERIGISRGRFVEQWRVLAPVWHNAEPCLYLVPRDERMSLRIVRIRSTLFTGTMQPGDELSAPNLLYQQASWLADGTISGQAKYIKSVNSEAWHIPIAQPSTQNMGRELCYFRYALNSAAVAEVRWEDDPSLDINLLLEKLLASLSAALPTAMPASDLQFRRMIEDGQAIITQQVKLLDQQYETNVSYDLMEMMGLPRLIRINYFAGSSFPGALTRQGWSRTYVNRKDEATLALQQTWSGTTDGLTFRLATSRSPLSLGLGQSQAVPLPMIKPGSPASMSMEILTLEGGKLQQTLLDNGQEKQVWTRHVPMNYLPVIFDDIWPLQPFFKQADEVNTEPKIVWLTRDRLPPSPCVVQAIGFGPARDASKISASIEREVYLWILIRPIVGLDSSLIGVNHHGIMVQGVMQTPRGPMLVRRLSREELLATGPWIGKTISELEAELATDSAKGSTP